MARPTKQGIDYFSFDTDFFTDRKVRRIMNACGPTSTSILICLLCNIYKDHGYYIVWDEELPFDIADMLGVSEGSVIEVIKKSIQVNFFDNTLFNKYKILTSNGIQKRFISSTAKRQNVEINPKYVVNSVKNRVIDVNIPSETELMEEESTQKESKVKESKVKDIEKEKTKRFSPPSLEEIKSYCLERGNKVNPEKFIDHYMANGWMVGKNKMKDWRAAVRNWEKTETIKPNGYKHPAVSYQQNIGVDERF